MVTNIISNQSPIGDNPEVEDHLGENSSLLEWAVAYAKAGFKIIPLRDDCPTSCVDPSCKKPKHPRLRQWQEKASSDVEQVREWWQKWPNANIGFLCRANGVDAIDLDTHNADGVDNFKKLKGDNPYPDTPTQRTPGGLKGGQHILCKGSSEYELVDAVSFRDSETGEMCPTGIETRRNNYILVQPSKVHGRAYKWLDGFSPLDKSPVEMPGWLRAIVTKEKRISRDVYMPQVISEADRNLAVQALDCIPSDDYGLWLQIGMALKSAGIDLSVWEEWSKKSDKYQVGACGTKWDSFQRGGVTIATVFWHAKQNGFQFPDGHFQPNDSGNAQRLVANFGHLMRWHKAEGVWLVWDGMRWKVDNSERPIFYAKETARLMFMEARDNEQRKFAASSASASKIDAMLKLAKPDLAITADMLDTDPFLLNCANGTIDLRTGELAVHRQEDFITKLAPAVFECGALAPRFHQFLAEIFAESAPLIQFVKRALGSSISGSVRDQKLFIPYGSGANGKSTLFGVIREILGDYAQETDPALLIAQHREGPSEGVFRLRGVRLATTIESDEEVKLNEARVKQLTGGDRLTARPLRGHFAEFNPAHKLWLVTNHLPRVKSQGHAIWRRIRLIPFNVQVPENKRDKDLPAKLALESSGILAWLVEGCLEWQSQGLPEPAEVMHATFQYQSEEDTLSDFIQECCYLDQNAQVQASQLRNEYINWCRSNKEIELSKNAFPARLREKGFGERETNAGKLWCGIGLKTDQPPTWDTLV